jgi:hypothetical protein
MKGARPPGVLGEYRRALAFYVKEWMIRPGSHGAGAGGCTFVISTRVLFGLVPALMAILLVAGAIERGAALASGVGITSDGALKGTGSPIRVLTVGTVFMSGVFEERNTEHRPILGTAIGGVWAVEAGAREVLAMPVGRAAPPCFRRCDTPPRGPPLA